MAEATRRARQPTAVELSLDGVACLKVHRAVVPCTAAEFDALEAFMRGVTPTPNRMRPSTNILRRQCAFVLPGCGVRRYDFGQAQDHFALDAAPALVAKVHRSMTDEAAAYDLVQCNYYEHGGVGISPHRDDEACIDRAHPIVSFSFYKHPEEARPFALFDDDDRKLLDVRLGHGDVLVMTGAMQEMVKHGVEKERANKYGPRLNLTLRATTKPSPSAAAPP